MPIYEKISVEEMERWISDIEDLLHNICLTYNKYSVFYFAITMFEYMLIHSYFKKNNVICLEKNSTKISLQTMMSLFNDELHTTIESMYKSRITLAHLSIPGDKYVIHIADIYRSSEALTILSTLGFTSDFITAIEDTMNKVIIKYSNPNPFKNAINKMF